MLINTGTPRSVTGHAVSGAIASLLISGAKHYYQYKQGKITTEEAIKQTATDTLQGGMITATAIAASNALGRQDILNGSLRAITYIATGAIASYAIHSLTQSKPQLPDTQSEPPLISGENHE